MIIKVKETSLPYIRLENIDKLRFVRNELTQLILVDPVDDEDEEIRPRTSDPPTLTMRDLKKRKELFTHLDRIDHHFFLHFFTGLVIFLL